MQSKDLEDRQISLGISRFLNIVATSYIPCGKTPSDNIVHNSDNIS